MPFRRSGRNLPILGLDPFLPEKQRSLKMTFQTGIVYLPYDFQRFSFFRPFRNVEENSQLLPLRLTELDQRYFRCKCYVQRVSGTFAQYLTVFERSRP